MATKMHNENNIIIKRLKMNKKYFNLKVFVDDLSYYKKKCLK